MNDLLHLLALYMPVDILFDDLNCYLVVITYSLKKILSLFSFLFFYNVIFNLLPGKT